MFSTCWSICCEDGWMHQNVELNCGWQLGHPQNKGAKYRSSSILSMEFIGTNDGTPIPVSFPYYWGFEHGTSIGVWENWGLEALGALKVPAIGVGHQRPVGVAGKGWTSLLKMAIEIVDLPIKNVIFHSYVSLPYNIAHPYQHRTIIPTRYINQRCPSQWSPLTSIL